MKTRHLISEEQGDIIRERAMYPNGKLDKDLAAANKISGRKSALIGSGIGTLAGSGLASLYALKTKKPLVYPASLGAIAGGLFGGAYGHDRGVYDSDKDFLDSKGISLGYMGLNPKVTDAAKKKYLTDYIGKQQ